MAHDVFISYSAKDKAIADAVCLNLEAEGIACWIAPRNIAIGETWASAIGGAINDCRIMVLILSARSAASKDVAREVNSADSERKIILPFWTEDIELAKPLDYYLRNTYRVDARAPGLGQHLPALVNAVKHLLQTAPAPGQTPSSFPGQCAPAPIPPIPARRWRRDGRIRGPAYARPTGRPGHRTGCLPGHPERSVWAS